jgi:hypothetical protein
MALALGLGVGVALARAAANIICNVGAKRRGGTDEALWRKQHCRYVQVER